MASSNQIRTALLSVYDKTGLAEFAGALAQRGVRLISTGGTARALGDAAVPVQPIEEFTGSAEMLGGRVKTLHPTVFGGILARRDMEGQMQELEDAALDPIDLVVVNLYPFQATVANPEHTVGEALEQIDIGGVSLLRAAYKNFAAVAVVVDPADYADVVDAIDGGGLGTSRRLALARKAVAHTAAYEASICNYLTALEDGCDDLAQPPVLALHPDSVALTFRRQQTLRYGENPHQPAAFYAGNDLACGGLATARQLQGKELSFNNFLDTDAAWQLVWSLPAPAAVVIKHANPCGAAIGDTLPEAYEKALSTDPVSAFGGIVGLNATVDESTAAQLAETFIEVVVAPDFDDAAREILEAKPNLRLLRLGSPGKGFAELPDYRWVIGGVLIQARDLGAPEDWQVVSRRQPSAAELGDLRFVWRLVPAVKSNAIVVGANGRLLGVGAGQMSRVDSCKLAVHKASDAGHELGGSVAASDAFFPFADGVETLAAAGVRAIVQPGGSRRDAEVIAAADRLDLALVHTGARHFRH